MGRPAAVCLTVLAAAWLCLIVVTPLAVANGERAWPAVVYQAAGLVCHQRPERSFHLAGVQLPVCARCLGFYASGTIGALLAWTAGLTRLSRRVLEAPRVPLAVAAVPTAVTVVLEWLGLAHPSGIARALAALPLGLLGGWIAIRLLVEARTTAGQPARMRYHA
jgi:uncharacterized membrane protein